MDQLRAIRTLSKVVDEGSFAGAARALEQAPAVVTRVIAELEDHLGARLLHRTTRKCQLTDIGEEYLNRVRPLLLVLEEADAQASNATSARPRGTLRIAAPAEFSRCQLMQLLPPFLLRYPQVDIEVRRLADDTVPDEGSHVSLLVGGGRRIEGEFVVRRIARATGVLCASPAYLQRHGSPARPEDLASHQVIIPALPGMPRTYLFQPLRPGLAEVAMTLDASAFSSPDPDTVAGAALAGLGIAGLLSFGVADELRRGTLVRLLPEWQAGPDWFLFAAVHSRRHQPRNERVFVDHLAERYPDPEIDPWLHPGPSPSFTVDTAESPAQTLHR
jgi:DNA-binding transcriptional LysR family regulator